MMIFKKVFSVRQLLFYFSFQNEEACGCLIIFNPSTHPLSHTRAPSTRPPLLENVTLKRENVHLCFRSCLTDMCECPAGRKCYCEAMTAYAHNCRRLGVSLPDWRTMTGCHTYWPASSHPSRVDSACLLLLVIVFLHFQLRGNCHPFTWPTGRNGQYTMMINNNNNNTNIIERADF